MFDIDFGLNNEVLQNVIKIKFNFTQQLPISPFHQN